MFKYIFELIYISQNTTNNFDNSVFSTHIVEFK